MVSDRQVLVSLVVAIVLDFCGIFNVLGREVFLADEELYYILVGYNF